jgi:F-type H+-transporting ATPase subunit b
MLNGWFTIAAQIVNFLVLVWLLKRFLYKPILDAIDQREKNIAAQLATAVATRTEAQKEHDNYEQKNKTFDQQRATMLTKATDDAKAERQKLIDQAHKDADALRAKAISALKVEQQQLNHEIRGWTQNQVFAIARKTLADLAAPSFEEALSDAFVVRLRDGDRSPEAARARNRSQCRRTPKRSKGKDRGGDPADLRELDPDSVRDISGPHRWGRIDSERTEGFLEYRALSDVSRSQDE